MMCRPSRSLLTCAGPEVHTAAGHSGTGAWLESLWPCCSPWGGALWHVSHHFYSLPKGVIIGEGWVGGRREWGDHCACKSKQVEHGGRGVSFICPSVPLTFRRGWCSWHANLTPLDTLGALCFDHFPRGYALWHINLTMHFTYWGWVGCSVCGQCQTIVLSFRALWSFYLLACPAVGTPPTDTKLCGASESMWCAGGTASEASPATDTHLSPIPLSDLLRVMLSDWERQRDP